MALAVGQDGLGDFARQQIEAAWRDPRLDRRQGAIIADYHDAIEEADRVRSLGIMGIYELRETLGRQEAELGVSHTDSGLTSRQRSVLQAHWERAESAKAEIENEFPGHNAQALISMNSALDALVEDFVQMMRRMQIAYFAGEILRRAENEVPEAIENAPDEALAILEDFVRTKVAEKLPKLVQRPTGSGASRYERMLARVGLAAPPDRPIPPHLDQALAELGAIRDVVVHRASRVDAKARAQAPSLRYREGELVRINREEFRTYSAAINCYAAEITYRPIRHWPEATEEVAPRLENWRAYCRICS